MLLVIIGWLQAAEKDEKHEENLLGFFIFNLAKN